MSSEPTETPASLTLAASPTSWGVDFADTPSNPPWPEVLDDIKQSGLGALELGPVGYLPEDGAILRAALERRGLNAVGSFVFEPLHTPRHAEEVLVVTRRACRAIQAAGGEILVVIDRPGGERAPTAGCSRLAQRLSKRRWEAMLALLDHISEIADHHGLTPTFHPHAGSYVEFQDEIERLLDDSALPLCLDTGHAAYAGIEPEQAIVTYAARLSHVHLKDVNPSVLQRGGERPLGFWEAIAAGVFCPLGAGVVDFAAVLSALNRAGYRGYATIEQDRVPGTGAPLEDLRASLQVLAAAARTASAP